MRRLSKLLLALALCSSLAACKKAAPPPVHQAVPTPTPVPDKDVLGFVRGGSIYAMRSDGQDSHVLVRPKAGQALWFPIAAPSGDHLLAWLSRANGTQDIVRVDLSGRMTVLTETGAHAQPLMKSLRLGNAPSYSPDGKRVAYSFNGDLWLMDANGYNAETFIADGASWAPAISPDGKRLAYVNGDDGHFDVWLADLDSRDTWQLTDFAEFTVGQPRWSKDGNALIVTRSQGEDSDIIQVTVPKDTGTVSDGDPLTRDHVSSGATWAPGNMHLLFSSARETAGLWTLYSSDPLGGNAKQLTRESSFSPFWLRPSTMTASVFDNGPSKPSPAAPVAVAPAMPAPGTAPKEMASKPQPPAAPGALPAKPEAPSAAAPPKPAAPSANTAVAPAKPAAPGASSVPGAAVPAKPTLASKPAAAAPMVAAADAPQAAAAPTQPPAKAAPLRLRLKASFDSGDKLALAGLAELKKMSPRVAQYAGESVTVIGPQDRSPLKGKFASEEARSKARAASIASELTKLGHLKLGVAKAQAYAPPAAGASGPPNSIQIYVELK